MADFDQEDDWEKEEEVAGGPPEDEDDDWENDDGEDDDWENDDAAADDDEDDEEEEDETLRQIRLEKKAREEEALQSAKRREELEKQKDEEELRRRLGEMSAEEFEKLSADEKAALRRRQIEEADAENAKDLFAGVGIMEKTKEQLKGPFDVDSLRLVKEADFVANAQRLGERFANKRGTKKDLIVTFIREVFSAFSDAVDLEIAAELLGGNEQQKLVGLGKLRERKEASDGAAGAPPAADIAEAQGAAAGADDGFGGGDDGFGGGDDGFGGEDDGFGGEDDGFGGYDDGFGGADEADDFFGGGDGGGGEDYGFGDGGAGQEEDDGVDDLGLRSHADFSRAAVKLGQRFRRVKNKAFVKLFVAHLIEASEGALGREHFQEIYGMVKARKDELQAEAEKKAKRAAKKKADKKKQKQKQKQMAETFGHVGDDEYESYSARFEDY